MALSPLAVRQRLCFAVAMIARSFFTVALFACTVHVAQAAPLSIVRNGQDTPKTADALAGLPGHATLDFSATTEPLGHAVLALPLDALLSLDKPLKFTASDGFSVNLTPALFQDAARRGARPWIAIEQSPHSWQTRDGQDLGPYALVWSGPGASAIPRERWVDRLVAVVSQPDAADPAMLLPEAGAHHAGAVAFATNCLPCHRLEGQGDGDKGPDLGKPVNVTRYITRAGFTAIVRNPRGVRSWPAQRMEGFPEEALSRKDLDAIWAYLKALGSSTPLH